MSLMKDESTRSSTELFVDRVAVGCCFAVLAAVVAAAVVAVPVAWSDGELWVAGVVAVLGALGFAAAIRCPFIGLRVTPDQVVVRTLVRTRRAALSDVLDVRVVEFRGGEHPAVVLRSGEAIKVVMLGTGNVWPELRSSGAKWDQSMTAARRLIRTRQGRN